MYILQYIYIHTQIFVHRHRTSIARETTDSQSRAGDAPARQAAASLPFLTRMSTHLGLLQLLHDAPRSLENVDAPAFPLAKDERLCLPLLHDLRQAYLDLELLVRPLRDLLDVLRAVIGGGTET